jgi:uncharacterized integral membrane protein
VTDRPEPPAKPVGDAPARGRRLATVRTVLIVVVLGLFVWFAVENSGRVKVDWWVVTTKTRLIFVILVSFAFGVVADRLFQMRRRRRRRRSERPTSD